MFGTVWEILTEPEDVHSFLFTPAVRWSYAPSIRGGAARRSVEEEEAAGLLCVSVGLTRGVREPGGVCVSVSGLSLFL